MANKQEPINLMNFFVSWDSARDEFDKLILGNVDADGEPTPGSIGVDVLNMAIEGLNQIEDVVNRRQFGMNTNTQEILENLHVKGAPTNIWRHLDNYYYLQKPIDVVQRLLDENEDEDERICDKTIILLAVNTLTSNATILIFESNCPNNYSNNLHPEISLELESQISSILREWRNEAPLFHYDENIYGRYLTMEVLRTLTIFRKLNVPLFIDNYGRRRTMSEFTVPRSIDGMNEDTFIYHVTHKQKAEKIVSTNQFEGSNNKNIVKGVWFGIDNPKNGGSVYGSICFRYQLRDFGITGLYQGEIVSYKYEVNVILYATNDKKANGRNVGFSNLMMPDERCLPEGAYVKVSIFVPESLWLRNHPEIPEPYPVKHDQSNFCVREKRNRGWCCPDRY